MTEFNKNLCIIREYVADLASKRRINKFYPQTISRNIGIPLDLVLIELTKLVDDGLILLKYEIRCDEDSDLSTLCVVDNYIDLLNTKKFCEVCGNEIEISYNNIYPIYYIKDEYKEYIKKKY